MYTFPISSLAYNEGVLIFDREALRASSKVLVCDDERHIVRLIQVNLERQNYVVAVAFSGREALEKAFTDPPDLLVRDTTLPDMTARAVLEAIRANPATAAIKVLFHGDHYSDDDDGPKPDGRLPKTPPRSWLADLFDLP